MRRFRFRLDPLLRLREHELDRSRIELRRVRETAERAAQLTDAARERARVGADALTERARRGVTALELGVAQRGVTQLFDQADAFASQAVDASAAVEQARQQVLEARTRLRALETLKERAQAEHRAEQARIEQAALDEVAGRTERVGPLGGAAR